MREKSYWERLKELTNNTNTIHNIAVEKTLLSDHDMVLCDLRFQQPNAKANKANKLTPDYPFDSMDLHNANWDAINHDLSLVDWSFTHALTPTNTKTSWKLFVDTVTNICSKHTPSRPVKKSKCRLPRDKKTLIRKIKRTNKKINQLKYCQQQHPHSSTTIALLETRKLKLTYTCSL